MGKEVNPKNDDITSAILAEGAAADQSKIKANAEKMGDQPGPKSPIDESGKPNLENTKGEDGSIQQRPFQQDGNHGNNIPSLNTAGQIPPEVQQELDRLRAFKQEADAHFEGLAKTQTAGIQSADNSNAPARSENPMGGLASKLGADTIEASKNGLTAFFTRTTWNQLAATPGRDGWKEVVQIPKEVQDLQNRQQHA